MCSADKFPLILKSIRQLGLKSTLLYAWYLVKLRSGLLRWQTPAGGSPSPKNLSIETLFSVPSAGDLQEVLGGHSQKVMEAADEVLDGQVRLFGGPPRPFTFEIQKDLRHWTRYVHSLPDGGDIKPIWELGRFGWATALARAYALSGDERYAKSFWQFTEQFLDANPPSLGPHWSSAQEVALRLIALAFCYTVFASSAESNQERKELLASSLAAHANRIPPTLSYARAQNNNHLLSEALGLYTAAALLPEHPKVRRWRRVGRKYFIEGVLSQIDPSGAYCQHSSNYHRLMLQLALWGELVARKLGDSWPAAVEEKLAAATRWLLAWLDTESGGVPNLGANDGAYILPLTVLPFGDHRPVLQAAGNAYLGETPWKAGVWDEVMLWLAPEPGRATKTETTGIHPLRIEARSSWAILRAARFDGRPGHADQLHLDLWWRGQNIALDPGTYRYNAPPPWDNALAATRVHNTVTINGENQMTRAGRFLWLDWAQARLLEWEEKSSQLVAATAEHDGYRRLGVLHRRSVRAEEDGRWQVEDELFSQRRSSQEIRARLHWLLPDWAWELEGKRLRLQSPHGEIRLEIETNPAQDAAVWLIRAGEVVSGKGEVDPIQGWCSPTYDLKLPALSLVVEAKARPPIHFRTTWILPK